MGFNKPNIEPEMLHYHYRNIHLDMGEVIKLLKRKFSKLNQMIQEEKGVHIFYNIKEQDTYICHLIAYIDSALEQGDHVLLIESQRIINILRDELKIRLTSEQMGSLHMINNFDYYVSTGSFQPEIIFDHLSKTLQPFYDEGISFRIWAHVEWGQQEGIVGILEEFEEEADMVANEQGLYLVCAYDQSRLPATLEEKLMKCHGYVMSENDIVVSELYRQPSKSCEKG